MQIIIILYCSGGWEYAETIEYTDANCLEKKIFSFRVFFVLSNILCCYFDGFAMTMMVHTSASEVWYIRVLLRYDAEVSYLLTVWICVKTIYELICYYSHLTPRTLHNMHYVTYTT